MNNIESLLSKKLSRYLYVGGALALLITYVITGTITGDDLLHLISMITLYVCVTVYRGILDKQYFDSLPKYINIELIDELNGPITIQNVYLTSEKELFITIVTTLEYHYPNKVFDLTRISVKNRLVGRRAIYYDVVIHI